MRVSPGVIGEDIEDAERRGADPDREPGRGRPLLFGERQGPGEEGRNLLLLAGLGLESSEDSDGHHGSSFPRLDANVPPDLERRDVRDERRCNEATPIVAVDLRSLVRRAGLEPATRCLEGSRSVQTELPAL